MVHTAMYDAWSAYDAVATHVSFDLEGDNLKVTGSDADKEKAMSYAALTVLQALYPEMAGLYQEVMEERLGHAMTGDGSVAAEIGIDAAEDLLALRSGDGSNQHGGFADAGGYAPFNPSPLEINDITRWTPENVPIDPEDSTPKQSFLTPHWLEVEGFGLPKAPDGEVTLAWETFSEAANEAGLSRLYGGIHFAEGDLNSRALGTDVGALAYETALKFIEGRAGDSDRPFADDFVFG